MGKARRFDIDAAIKRVRKAVEDAPKAAMFELAELGHASAFEQLVACIISIRTRDEVMLPVARRLFASAPTPARIAALTVDQLDALIAGATFHRTKAVTIRDIATEVCDSHGGTLPCDRKLLLSLRGVGPKCANLVMGIACGEPHIGVDVHVHRITNRWGYVSAATAEGTMAALESVLPKKYWVEINRLLVPFGKRVCTGSLPRCSTCPLLSMCAQVGVDRHR